MPLPYMSRAVEHLLTRGSAALFLDPGLGKTAITLEAFRQLKEQGRAKKMLVVAPLRVCQLVWRQEGRKWTQFRDLTFSLIHGPKKEKALAANVDIHLINPEGVAWLTQQFYGRSDLPWDTVVLDEITKFKNHRAKRSKKLRGKLKEVKRRWGLTGSPAPNGYMDLFGQMLMLDDGAALGRYVTYFRDQYFTKGWDGFSYDIRPGAAERIEAKIAPYVLRMSAEDYLDLPPLVDHKITVQLSPVARKKYEELKQEMILSLPEGVITAANAAASYSKLKQMTNGAVYLSNETEKKWVEVHDTKLEALEELIEELSGTPLLVAYEFQHDLKRIQARLGEDTPTLSGLSGKRIAEVEAQWNRGELPVLLVHPASAGHGLNLQGAGASHICWFSKTWDLEMYDQTIRRIYRQGSTSDRVVNHSICVEDTIDEIVESALADKDITQSRLLDALNAEVLRDYPAPSPVRVQPKEDKMALKKLGFKTHATDHGEDAPVVPKGWGTPVAKTSAPVEEPAPESEAPARPKGWGPPAGAEVDEQRSEVRAKLQAPAPAEEEEVPPSVKALQAFPPGVVQMLTGEDAPQPEAHALTEPTWDDFGGRTKKAAEYFATPREAHAAGKSELVKNIDGFGPKSWTELDEVFGGLAPVLRMLQREMIAEQQQAMAAEEKRLNERDEEEPEAEKPSAPPEVQITATYMPSIPAGAKPATLATLFDAIASLLRGE